MLLDDLIQAADQLNETDLDQLLQQVVTLRARRKAPVIPEEEAVLLEQINQRIPTNLRTEYDLLRGKREAETLTEAEHTRLIQLSQSIENFGVHRLDALAKLAQLRQVPLLTLMETLGIPSVTHV